MANIRSSNCSDKEVWALSIAPHPNVVDVTDFGLVKLGEKPATDYTDFEKPQIEAETLLRATTEDHENSSRHTVQIRTANKIQQARTVQRIEQVKIVQVRKGGLPPLSMKT